MGIVARLEAAIAEVEDIMECAENACEDLDNLRWRGVQHKAQEALGALNQAFEAAQQAEAAD